MNELFSAERDALAAESGTSVRNRTLVISDIHGNIDALRAIDEPCDGIICLGDIVDYGPSPRECIDYLREREVLRARGNHDHAVAFCKDCRTPDGPLRQLSVSSRTYTMQVLGEAETRWLGEADTSVRAELDGRRVFAVHGAPSDHMYKYLAPRMPEDVLHQEVMSTGADIVFVGHTHHPFIKEFDDGKLLVNVGSVGQPRDGIPKASYAIVENGSVRLKRAEYDVEAAIARTRTMPLPAPVRERLVSLLEHGRTTPPVRREKTE